MSEDALRALVAPLAPLGERAWAVGGGVRDALLGRAVDDLDVAVAGDGRAAAAALARAHGATRFRLSRAFGAWRVQGGALPYHVDITPLQGADLAEDLGRRDLTVNALAVPAAGPEAGRVVDLYGGLGDLAARRLRLVHARALADDPVRLLRMARLGEALGFRPDPAAVARARADARLVWDTAGERLADELGRIARLPRPDRAFERLDELGGLGALVPELERARGLDQSPYHHKDVLGHTIEVVQHVAEIARDPEPVFRSRAGRVRAVLEAPLADELRAREGLVITALLHDMAKADTHAVTPEGRVTFMAHDRLGAEQADALMRRLRTSTRLREFVVRGIRWHLPLGFMVHRAPLSLRQIHRYLRLTAPSEAEIIVLTVADRLATAGPRTTESAIRRHLVLAREVMDAHFTLVDRGPVRPLIAGDELARELGRAPGPWLAELLGEVGEGQVVGALRTRDQVLRFARRWSEQRNVGPRT
ncbi:HD domain-containing protein [Miltoncostaea marina]|uniref:HD domain-containing protein n=1 Tax=Miltoncostaea marina TaxID=2843215 RepID=UPI001C3C459D|nr:HD domain-containing protein [Miltoncostaea marina]